MPTDYTLILLDGARQDINSTTFPNSTYSQQFFMSPIAIIDRIKIIRGYASTIYDTDAISGAEWSISSLKEVLTNGMQMRL
ncbi:TonB-dependent receptor plug domain-containing protein [uncultured Helicobacter sp.]|uniref:TonB-dependent receptor plug domain-containing protein n=1 Tax=uncultured Helicobacter sp. TaxID=175537 RepID=UPI00261DA76A|nr:TonB-dependent receptor plug domain-containing protein [uncultured Helicobacter sp.]